MHPVNGLVLLPLFLAAVYFTWWLIRTSGGEIDKPCEQAPESRKMVRDGSGSTTPKRAG